MKNILESIDHVVLTVRDIDATSDWYARVFGTKRERDGARVALRIGDQKINLHQAGAERSPHAEVPTRGSGDLCFLTSSPLDEVQKRLADEGVALVEGPVERSGARGPMLSIYCRDPDGNLIEVSNLLP